MPKCPPNQTYNRTLKACRDKKKVGRKTIAVKAKAKSVTPKAKSVTPKAKSATPKAKSVTPKAKAPSARKVTFEFSVTLKSSTRYSSMNDFKKVVIDDVIDWYESEGADLQMNNLKITYNGKSEFSGSYTLNPEENPKYDPQFEIATFVDNDEDGNHPIKIGRTDYFVMGKLISVNGVKYED